MSSSGLPGSNGEEGYTEIKRYKIRWFFLIALVLFVTTQHLTRVSFGLINNIIVAYFGISYIQVDWLILAYSIGCIISVPILAWIIHRQAANFRQLVLLSISFSLINYGLQALSCAIPFYPLSMLGGIVGGVAITMAYTFPAKLAALWFPESQIGITTSVMFSAITIGTISGLTLPANILENPQNGTTVNKTSSDYFSKITNFTTFSETQDNMVANSEWFVKDNKVLVALFASLFCGLFFIAILLYLLMPSEPNSPPSVAAALKRKTSTFVPSHKTNFRTFLSETGLILLDKEFFISSVAYISLFGSILIEETLFEQMMQSMLQPLHTHEHADLIASSIMLYSPIGGFFGVIFAGKLLDFFKKYQHQSIAGSVLAFISILGIQLSWRYTHLIVIKVCMATYGFSSRLGMVSSFDAVMQHTYPRDPLFVTAWIIFFSELYIIATVEVGRLLFIAIGSQAVLLLHSILIIISILLSIIAKPRLHRLNAEESNAEAENETEITQLVEK